MITLPDYEAAAKDRLDEMGFEYLASGVADDITLGLNIAAYRQIGLLPRVMVDVSRLDPSVVLFGREHASPLLLAPTGYHRLFHPEGELETVRGANLCKTTLVAACFATVPYRAMRRESTEPLWFQLYIQPDRSYTRALVEEVLDAGCEAICVTVDFPVNSPRDRERRVHFALPAGVERKNLQLPVESASSIPESSSRSELYNGYRAANVTWKDVEWLRSFVDVPLLLKGVGRPEDARVAVEAGCDGIMVSNHGGRSIDGIPASLRLLPGIADAVGDRATVLLDGGIRRGTDVLKALALGADAVMIGRPYLYGLAVQGARGVQEVVHILQTEFLMAMGNCGCRNLREIDRSLLEMHDVRG